MEIGASLMDFPSKAPGKVEGIFFLPHPVNLIWELGKGEEEEDCTL